MGSQTRAWILKSLSKRRYTISELSRLLKVSKPTVLYHLRILENSGYVRKLKDGRKWTYYELTDLGKSLAKILAPIAVATAIFAIVIRMLERTPIVETSIMERRSIAPEPIPKEGEVPKVAKTPAHIPEVKTPMPQGYQFPWEIFGIALIIAVVVIMAYVKIKRKK